LKTLFRLTFVLAVIVAAGCGPSTTPTTPGEKAARADALMAQSRFNDALELYSSALSEAPDSPDAPLWRAASAEALAEMGRFSEALNTADRVINSSSDPAVLSYLVETVRELLGRLPIFGICLGHQILGQAVGGRTEKLKFGHHGINQPVRQIRSGQVEITSQNHGFVVSPESLTADLEKTHENLNDGTSEGIAYPSLRAFSVQYHPEAAPGPQDAAYLFNQFIETMTAEKGRLPRNPS